MPLHLEKAVAHPHSGSLFATLHLTAPQLSAEENKIKQLAKSTAIRRTRSCRILLELTRRGGAGAGAAPDDCDLSREGSREKVERMDERREARTGSPEPEQVDRVGDILNSVPG